MKITTYQQLDELVANEIGYVFYEEKVDFYGEFITNYCWIEPSVKSEDYSKHLNHFVHNSYFEQYQGSCPRFSTNVFLNEELVNYIINDPLLSISTWLTKKSSWAAIYHFDKRWVGYCGEDMNLIDSIDSPINSLSLAICLAFLKYKGIEVELEIDDTI